MNIEKIIKDNERLIYKIASKYSMYYSYEDLFQVGAIGIIKAYKNYNISSDAKFSSYAYKYIFGEIINFIKRDRNIIISDDMFSIYKKYIKIKELLYSKYNREIKLKEISEYMCIDESYLVFIIESVAFTKGINDDYDCSYDERENIDNKIFLDEELSTLDIFDRSLIDYRYYQGYTQSETANILGVSQVKVSRQEKLILNKIRNNIVN